MTNFESLKETLTKYGQEHLLQFWDELNETERKQLISDIQELNLAEVQSFFQRANASLEESSAKLDDRLQPVPESTFLSISRTNTEQLKVYSDEGKILQIQFFHMNHSILNKNLNFLQGLLKSHKVVLEFY